MNNIYRILQEYLLKGKTVPHTKVKKKKRQNMFLILLTHPRCEIRRYLGSLLTHLQDRHLLMKAFIIVAIFLTVFPKIKIHKNSEKEK